MVDSGVASITSSVAATEFLPNGATRGNSGNTATAPALSNVPLCNFTGSADLRITKTNTPLSGPGDRAADTVVSGATTTCSLVFTNAGPNPVAAAVISDTPGAGLTCARRPTS